MPSHLQTHALGHVCRVFHMIDVDNICADMATLQLGLKLILDKKALHRFGYQEILLYTIRALILFVFPIHSVQSHPFTIHWWWGSFSANKLSWSEIETLNCPKWWFVFVCVCPVTLPLNPCILGLDRDTGRELASTENGWIHHWNSENTPLCLIKLAILPQLNPARISNIDPVCECNMLWV